MLTLVVCLSIAPVASAQQLVIDAATPLIVSAQSAGTTSTQTLPGGPLPAFGQINASSGMATAATTWQVEATPIALTFDLWQLVAVGPQAPAPASASSGPHEYLLHLRAASPIDLVVSGHQWFDLLPGSPFPLLQVDVFDDGSPEFVLTSTSTGPEWPIAYLTVGPQPVPIRVRASSVVGAAGLGSNSRLHLTVTPNNQLDISRVAVACTPSSFFACHPSFVGTGVDFWVSTANLYPSVLVLGLGLQPTVLPSYSGVPCILAPSPDAVLFAATANTPFTLPLPPAVRPVTVYAQVVHLFGAPLVVTDGFRVNAY